MNRVPHISSKESQIFTDPLIEKVFYNLFDNALRHWGEQPNPVHLTSQESDRYLTLVCEDNGVGVLNEDEKRLFTQGFGKNPGLGLFLPREILSITDITITERYRNVFIGIIITKLNIIPEQVLV